MRANADTVIVGEKVVLVPYRPEHVPKYHEWMLSDELRELTASEPLTLEEEYDMQRKWQMDEDKLTFIILARGQTLLPLQPGAILPESPLLADLPMIGDVNVFLYGSHLLLSRSPSVSSEEGEEDEYSYAEAEIMIAENAYRRGGFATEALRLMLSYTTGQPSHFFCSSTNSLDINDGVALVLDSRLGISPYRFVSRIGSTNEASIKLFQKLGFQITKRIEIFDEVEMRYRAAYVGSPST